MRERTEGKYDFLLSAARRSTSTRRSSRAGQIYVPTNSNGGSKRLSKRAEVHGRGRTTTAGDEIFPYLSSHRRHVKLTDSHSASHMRMPLPSRHLAIHASVWHSRCSTAAPAPCRTARTVGLACVPENRHSRTSFPWWRWREIRCGGCSTLGACCARRARACALFPSATPHVDARQHLTKRSSAGAEVVKLCRWCFGGGGAMRSTFSGPATGFRLLSLVVDPTGSSGRVARLKCAVLPLQHVVHDFSHADNVSRGRNVKYRMFSSAPSFAAPQSPQTPCLRATVRIYPSICIDALRLARSS